MQKLIFAMTPLLSIALITGCDRVTAHPDSAGTNEYTGGCVDFVTRPDGSMECMKVLEDLGSGWNCCSEATNTCTEGANTRSRKNPDGSSTTVVHCGQGYYPVFCQDSKTGLICTTTEQLP